MSGAPERAVIPVMDVPGAAIERAKPAISSVVATLVFGLIRHIEGMSDNQNLRPLD